jgi:hypothetical protein
MRQVQADTTEDVLDERPTLPHHGMDLVDDELPLALHHDELGQRPGGFVLFVRGK